MEQTELLILGAGSAGFGAAYRALCGGVSSVVLIDKNPGPGGTSVFAGVNCWEPGVGGNGVHYEIAKRLTASGGGFVGKTTEYCGADRPYAVSDRSEEPYEATLRSAGVSDDDYRRFHFEPEEMCRVMRELLAEADTKHALTELYHTEFLSAESKNGCVTAVTVQTPEGKRTFFPKLVLDCSAELVLARAAGCSYTWGEEPASLYGEEAAPETEVQRVNGLTQCFRMEKDTPDGWDGGAVPAGYGDVDLADWNAYMERTNGPVSCFNVCPRGGISVNMLPTMEGEELFRLPRETVKHICEARVYSYFLRLRRRSELAGFRITKIFPMLGVRESVRLVGSYVLTHNDLQNGYAAALGKHHTIAWADHPADVHGGGYRMIPAQNIDCISAAAEAMGYYGRKDVFPVYYESALKVKYARDDMTAKMIDLIRENSRTDFLYMNNVGSLGTIFESVVKSGSNTFESSYQKNEKKALKDLDKLKAELETDRG